MSYPPKAPSKELYHVKGHSRVDTFAPRYSPSYDSPRDLSRNRRPDAPYGRRQALHEERSIPEEQTRGDNSCQYATFEEVTESDKSKTNARCDNYGCNGNHNHDDCPLSKCCWGCHSMNHFWSECPMTCRDCGSKRHVPRYCNDFEELKVDKIAYPRRLWNRGNTGSLPYLPLGKSCVCDNHGCDETHGSWDCSLSALCTGCGESGHYWSECEEQCSRCRLAMHISRFCDDFKPWKMGKSKPKKANEDAASRSSKKRQRESAFELNQIRDLEAQKTKRKRSVSTSLNLHSSPDFIPIHERNADLKLSPGTRENRTSLPAQTNPERALQISRGQRPSTISLSPRESVERHDNRIIMRDNRERDKVYCAFWLRNGQCNYENTDLGCKYKHEVPDKQTLRAMGIEALPRGVKEKQLLQNRHRQNEPELGRLKARSSASPGTGALKAEAWLDENIDVGTTASYVQNRHPSYHQEPSPPTSGSRLLQGNVPEMASRSTQISCAESKELETKGPFPKSDREKAFEEEEHFKQKRHEAEMKRRAEQQRLEIEHEQKLAELRRR